MATHMYDPARLEAIRRHLEYAVVAVVREALPSPLVIDDYASAMVACDEAEEREVEAGVLMELLVACQEAAEFITECSVSLDIDSYRYGPIPRRNVELRFSFMPERLFNAMSEAITAMVPGCCQVRGGGIRFRICAVPNPISP